MWAVMICLVPVLGNAQENDYQLFELFYFTPMSGHGAELEAAMSKHNKEYHAPGDYSAQVYYVLNGPNAGKYVWSMGPTTWTKIETRPADDGHDGHWDEQVGIHIESYGGTDYYKLNAEMSHFPGPTDLKTLNLWMVDLKEGTDYRYEALMEKVLSIYEENDYDRPMGVYDRQFGGSHGIDVVMIWFMEGLQGFDEEGPFGKDYEAKYGEGSMDDLVKEWMEIVDRMDQEIWKFVPEMSGHDGTAVSRATQD